MMYQIMQSINNFFERTAEAGTFQITEGKISNLKAKYIQGQYVRIMDSIMNDGVFKIKSVQEDGSIELDGSTTNEEFTGYIVGLAIPKSFIELTEKMQEYDVKLKKHKGVASESIPNYSVSYDTSIKSIADAFKSELSPFRKPYIAKYYFLNWTKNYE